MKNKRGPIGKSFALVFAAALVIVSMIGTTIAWLTDETIPVTNTFTYGDINISLIETTGSAFHILPGNDIAKDPTVTVEANSEDCWIFVKIEKENWPTFTEDDTTTLKVAYIVDTTATGWTKLTESTDGTSIVYYRSVTSNDTDQSFGVLTNNEVTVSENLTKEEINSVTTQPSLTFTAYAVQKSNVDTALTAWENILGNTVSATP